MPYSELEEHANFNVKSLELQSSSKEHLERGPASHRTPHVCITMTNMAGSCPVKELM